MQTMLFQKKIFATLVVAFSLMMAAPAYGAIYYVGVENPGSGQNYNNAPFFQIECRGCSLTAATNEWLAREWQSFLGASNGGQNYFSNNGDGMDNFGFFVTGQGTWAGRGLGFSSYSLSYLGAYNGTPIPWLITGNQGSDNGSGLMTIIVRELFPNVNGNDFEMLGWFDTTVSNPACNPFIQKNGNWVVELPRNAKIALCTRRPGTSVMVGSSLMVNGFQPFAVMRQWADSAPYPTMSGLPPGPIIVPPPGGGGGGTPPANPVPEPSSKELGLVGLGLILLAATPSLALRRAVLKK